MKVVLHVDQKAAVAAEKVDQAVVVTAAAAAEVVTTKEVAGIEEIEATGVEIEVEIERMMQVVLENLLSKTILKRKVLKRISGKIIFPC